MNTRYELQRVTDKMTAMVDDLSTEEATELHNQTVKINAKLMVLNKFETELQDEINILNEKISKIEGNKTTGKTDISTYI